MAHIHIDSDSLQGAQHLARQGQGYARSRLSRFIQTIRQGQGYGRSRLSSFIQTIESQGHSVDFCAVGGSESEWKSSDLLIIPTRLPESSVDAALSDIEHFVSQGGSLLLLSNHSRVPANRKMRHYTHEDAKVARLFDIQLAEVCLCTERSLTSIDNAGPDAHPVLLDKSGNRVVNSVVVNNGCAIDRNSAGIAVLWWPTNVVDIGPHCVRPDGMAFCWARETAGGRVLVVGDSGFVGEPNVPVGGPGLFDQGENSLFIQQAIGWLLGT